MSDHLSGTHFLFSENTVRFFGAMVTKLTTGGWGVYNTSGDNPVTPIEPHPVKHNIVRVVTKEMRSNKKRMRFAQLQLGCRYAAFFALEGELTREHLRLATEYDTHIDIPYFNFEGYRVTLRIMDNDYYDFATADHEGKIL